MHSGPNLAAPDRHMHHLSRKGRIVAYLGGPRPAYPGWASVAPAGRHPAPGWALVAPGRPASGTRVGFRQADVFFPGSTSIAPSDRDRSQRPDRWTAISPDRHRAARPENAAPTFPRPASHARPWPTSLQHRFNQIGRAHV